MNSTTEAADRLLDDLLDLLEEHRARDPWAIFCETREAIQADLYAWDRWLAERRRSR